MRRDPDLVPLPAAFAAERQLARRGPGGAHRTRRSARRGTILAAATVAALCAWLTACGRESAAGPETCQPTARYPTAIGCAYVYGTVTDTRGAALDSVDGLVRLSDACACSSPRIEGDDNGVYATVVHRLARPAGFSDTATATVVVLASAPKYPRHVTGAAYFDTLQLVLRFARVGEVPPPTQVDLRIPLPLAGR